MNVIKIYGPNYDELAFNTYWKKFTNGIIDLSYKHLNYCFLIVGTKDSFFRLIHYSNHQPEISFYESSHPDAYLALISANLINLRDWIIDLSNGTNDLRGLSNQFQEIIEKDGYRDLFSELTKTSHIDEWGYRLKKY